MSAAPADDRERASERKERKRRSKRQRGEEPNSSSSSSENESSEEEEQLVVPISTTRESEKENGATSDSGGDAHETSTTDSQQSQENRPEDNDDMNGANQPQEVEEQHQSVTSRDNEETEPKEIVTDVNIDNDNLPSDDRNIPPRRPVPAPRQAGRDRRPPAWARSGDYVLSRQVTSSAASFTQPELGSDLAELIKILDNTPETTIRGYMLAKYGF